MNSLKFKLCFLFIVIISYLCRELNAEAGNYFFDTVETNIKIQAESAKFIFNGVVEFVSKEKTDEKNRQYYEVKFNVFEDGWIKGREDWISRGNSLRVFSTKISSSTKDSFGFNEGEEVVVAFYDISKSGFTSPIALGDGLYKVEKEFSPKTRLRTKGITLNKIQNIGLVRDVESNKLLNSSNSELLNKLDKAAQAGNSVSKGDLISVFKEFVEQ